VGEAPATGTSAISQFVSRRHYDFASLALGHTYSMNEGAPNLQGLHAAFAIMSILPTDY
jgi:hypothetical protein